MKRTTKTPIPDAVAVRYDLHDLPTAHHKAGLAGLLLQIASMTIRRPAEEVPQIEANGAASVCVRFTPCSLQCLFDELYAGKRVDVWVKKKWKDSKKREKPPKGEKTVERRFPRAFKN